MEAGYVVETVRPGEARIAPADLELTVDKLPVVEAWRHVPAVDTVYVAPETPESQDIRSDPGVEKTHAHVLANAIAGAGQRYRAFTSWLGRQAREVRAHAHDLRQKWTPPREYHAPVHLEPMAPSNLDLSHDPVTDSERWVAASRKEEQRRKKEIERQQRILKQARAMEDNRRRVREVEEARAMLEQQKRIEAMVDVTEVLRERVMQAGRPVLAREQRKRPRRLLRTRRDRAFFRAGVTAFALSMGIALLAGEVLHPQPASHAIPQNVSSANNIPFADRPSAAPVSDPSQNASEKVPSVIPFRSAPAVAVNPVANVSPAKPAASQPSPMQQVSSRGTIAEDEVIIRKPLRPRHPAGKPKDSIVHYSDLD